MKNQIIKEATQCLTSKGELGDFLFYYDEDNKKVAVSPVFDDLVELFQHRNKLLADGVIELLPTGTRYSPEYRFKTQ